MDFVFRTLVIEKLLKGLYAKKNEENPYTIKFHNLLALAERCLNPLFFKIILEMVKLNYRF